ncbi:MAG: M48 family metallopeptidase [Alphaproteobacteria bacterium]|nr:M48 family metallopeptidase [Alphaproteobacteria bacterium]
MYVFPARYFDGVTARPTDVAIRIDADGVRVQDQDSSGILASWPANDVRLVERPRRGGEMRLRRDGDGAERILFSDDRALTDLRANCPKLNRLQGGFRNSWRPILIWGSAAAASVAFIFFVALPFMAERAAGWIPQEVEDDLGTRVADQMAGFFARSDDEPRFCSSPAGAIALQRMVDRLRDEIDYEGALTVRVVSTPEVNAFALPGGQILIFEGLLNFAKDAEAVAGVLAHELGHVEHRHPLEVFLKNAGAGAILGLLLGDVSGGAIGVIGAQLYLRASYGQEAEREADAVALRVLNASDIRGGTYAEFFAQLREKHGEQTGALAMFSTHPGHVEREAHVRAESSGRGTVLSAEDWDALRTICETE